MSGRHQDDDRPQAPPRRRGERWTRGRHQRRGDNWETGGKEREKDGKGARGAVRNGDRSLDDWTEVDDE